MSALLLAFGLAAATPRLVYKPDPARSADVATVSVQMPRQPCYGLVQVSVLLSSAKADRQRVYALSVTLADAPFPPHISGAVDPSGASLRLINVRDGDVGCTEYQCQSGSTAVFALDEGERAAIAAGGWAAKVAATGGSSCVVPVAIEPAVLTTLNDWAGRLAPSKGD